MNQLVTACLVESNLEPLVSFPRPLMNEFECEVVDWILSYRKIHGAIPIISRLLAEYPHFMPIAEVGIPITDIQEQTLQRKRKEFAIGRIGEIELELRDADDIPLDKLTGLLRVLSASSSGLDFYSTFDRSRYFRHAGGGLHLGFRLIDRAIGNLQNGDYALISGRLGSGKSTTTQWITYNWWNSGKRILFVSNEMMSEDIFGRFDGMVGKFNPLLLRSSSEIEKLAPTLKVVKHIVDGVKGEIIVPHSRLMTPASVSAIAEHLEIDVIVIDGVYLMFPDEKGATAKWERVAAVSNALKQIAISLGIPLVGVTQIKRVGEKEKFDAEDLAYSDALGQDADFAIGIHPSTTEKGVSELQLFKNRYGPQMTTRARIDFDTMTVTDESVMVTETEVWTA